MTNEKLRAVATGILSILVLASGALGQAPPATMPTIYGRVTGTDGKPVADAVILVSGATVMVGQDLKPATTDAQGRFQLTGVGGRVFVNVKAAGFGLTSAVLRPGSESEPNEIRLKLGTDVRLKLIAPEGGPAAGVKIAVQAVRDSGTGISGMAQNIPELTQTSDAGGAVVFPGMPRGGTLYLNILDDQYANTLTTSAPEGIPLGDDARTDGGEIRLEKGASISGRIAGPDGKGIGEMQVYAQSTANNRIRSYATTMADKEGNFTIKQMPAGTHNVNVYMRSDISAKYAVKEIEPVTVAPGEQVSGKDIALITGGILTGRITVEGTGAPVPGVSISIAPVVTTGGARSTGSTQTGPDGNYTIHALPGTVQVIVNGASQEGLLPPLPNSRQVEVADGATATVDFQYRQNKNPALKGRVVDQEGKPIAGASVAVESADNPQPALMLLKGGGSNQSDADGRFTIAAVADGSVLRIRKGTMGTAQQIVVGSNRDITVTLQKDVAGSAIVRVKDEAGAPIPDAQVMVLNRIGGRGGRGGMSYGTAANKTGKDGTSVIESLFPDSTYSIQVSAKGYGRSTTPGDLQVQSGKQIEALVTLPKANSFVGGMVMDLNGEPMAGVEVRISSARSGPIQGIKTDVTGRFRAEGIVAGDTVTVYTMANGRPAQATPERVAAGVDNLILTHDPSSYPRAGGRRGAP